MGAKLDLAGQVFHRLTVISEAGRSTDKKVTWHCECSCGNKVIVVSNHLRRGTTRSCGCLQKEALSRTISEKVKTHGLTNHPLFKVWENMRDRCSNPRHKSYKYYGGKGILVCDRWDSAFKNFYADVIDGYGKGLQLDRKDNNGNCEPENVRWVTPQQNMQNIGSRGGSSSTYKGVSFNKKHQKWAASITRDGKKKWLGLFTKEEEAAAVYNQAAEALFGEFAYLNNIKGY